MSSPLLLLESDFSLITPQLFQGGEINPSGEYAGFSMIVLCAFRQPALPNFKGMIIRAPFEDHWNPTTDEITIAQTAAHTVARELQRGGYVLVTCLAGLNRSGLVVGLALNATTELTGIEVVRLIQKQRADALCNQAFAELVIQLNPRK